MNCATYVQLGGLGSWDDQQMDQLGYGIIVRDLMHSEARNQYLWGILVCAL